MKKLIFIIGMMSGVVLGLWIFPVHAGEKAILSWTPLTPTECGVQLPSECRIAAYCGLQNEEAVWIKGVYLPHKSMKLEFEPGERRCRVRSRNMVKNTFSPFSEYVNFVIEEEPKLPKTPEGLKITIGE
ncbi:MAG: hypothetical protein GWN00_19945 [Aliifodinibius sp.]|nr:hypothetical protein [Fodinibius sp.]NIY26994.1 hypothetical protein [Fodinibius sp.]